MPDSTDLTSYFPLKPRFRKESGCYGLVLVHFQLYHFLFLALATYFMFL